METLKIKINGTECQVPKQETILNAAKAVHIKIPKLCKHPDLPSTGACGLCIVKEKGNNKLLRACITLVQEGMDIVTHDGELYEIRKNILELILSAHPNDCFICQRNGDCELQTLAMEFGIREQIFTRIIKDIPKDTSTQAIVMDTVKCVGCGRCVNICQNIQDVWALEFLYRGFDMQIAPAGYPSLKESPCIKCGQCTVYCPVGALIELDETHKAWDALGNKELYPVVQISPVVNVSVGEKMGLEHNILLRKKLYALLKAIGFKAVFDTNCGVELTIMEQASEIVEIVKNKRFYKFPLITNFCPAVIDYVGKYYPELTENCSKTKSPYKMVGFLTKTSYAEKMNIDPEKIFMVSIMPCTATKYEITKGDGLFSPGYQDVDISLTTREFVRMIKASGIQFLELKEEEPDNISGYYTNNRAIFGITGSGTEAVLKTVYVLLTGKKLENLEFSNLKGLKGIKTAIVAANGFGLKVAVVHGIGNVKHVLDEVRKARAEKKEIPYHFIEIMACEKGCIGGGGQPYGGTNEIKEKRVKGLYQTEIV